MDINEIQSLIKFVSKSGVSEVELETNDFKITIKSPGKGNKRKKGQQQEEPTIIQTQMPMGTMPAMPQMQQPAMPQQQPATPPPAAPAQEEGGNKKEEKTAEEDESKYVTIKSPMIGTFYRSPSPDKDPYINVGDSIKEGDTICIIEAMKLFNEIEAEVSGKIVKVLADDASPVEYDQPLFLVDPS